jgi:hypothetical protein
MEFGEAMPAFRVVVNSASVHGSIGYSTNLFPAMTLGCGAPGGNITSDNIGPQHLLNVKRIAWETRGVEHRTVPASQRMMGAANPSAPEAVQKKVNVPAAPSSVSESSPSASSTISAEKLEDRKNSALAPMGSTGGVDRAAIARAVENVLVAQGIARGSGAPHPLPAPGKKESASPASIAAEIANRLFGPSAKPKAGNAETPVSPAVFPEAAKKPEPTPKTAIEIQVFVSENDVRRAMTRSEKIFIGRKTILTPSARDLGLEHEVFVETEAGSLR